MLSSRFHIRRFSSDLTNLMVRAPTSYTLFLKESNVGAIMKDKNVKVNEAFKLTANNWQKLSPAEKKVYQDKAQQIANEKNKEVSALPLEKQSLLVAMRKVENLKKKDRKMYSSIRKKVAKETRFPTSVTPVSLYVKENVGSGTLKTLYATKPYSGLSSEAKTSLARRVAEMNERSKTTSLEQWKKQTKFNSLLEAMATEYMVQQKALAEKQLAAKIREKEVKQKKLAVSALKKKAELDKQKRVRQRLAARARAQAQAALSRQRVMRKKSAKASAKKVAPTKKKSAVKAKGQKVLASKLKAAKAKASKANKPALKKKKAKA